MQNDDVEVVNILHCCGGHEEHLDNCAQVEWGPVTQEELDELLG